ncbi:hypothetical protein [Candidatus Chloroploca sp. Khr17]|uniref:hypothetical protein n=1 Tax=Candidatus Chloroploca sp. Khr17 TaxID=2496869 RepID=UPI00101D08FC|nr:hypothetical protein [Candidatus Chloroploca sp. Khr17]
MDTRLQRILSALHDEQPLTPSTLDFLLQQGLYELYRLAIGALSYERFHELALAEQARRMQQAVKAKRAREAQAEIREAGRLEQERRSLDEVNNANQALCQRYGIPDFVAPRCPHRLMDILKRVSAGQRLHEKDRAWLVSIGEGYFTPALRSAFHHLEARFFASEFHKTHDPWAAVNASSHYRKCNGSHNADALLSTINPREHPPKLHAAILTTHGGVMRDLKHWSNALLMGEQAHELQPKDYRPCTLLGAVYMQTGQHALGQAWYDKAIERGANVAVIDRDIRTILSQLPPPQRRALEDFLLEEDPIRFAWIHQSRRSREGDGSAKNPEPKDSVRRRR